MRGAVLYALLIVLSMASCRSGQCGPGLYLVDGVCTTEPPDCGCRAGEVCDYTQPDFACVCAPGYAGNPCEWVGVVNDELFDEGDLYWTGVKGATVLPISDGPEGGGKGSLEPSVVCNAGALSQTVLMPPYDASGSLVAEVRYRTEDVERFGIGFNGAWTHLPKTQGAWEKKRFCLGAAAFGELPSGGAVEVELGPSEKGSSCFADPQKGMIEIDRFTIEPPAESETCIEPGAVLNGEANVEEGGWRFERGGLAEAGLIEDAGSDPPGDDGVRLHRPVSAVDLAAATTEISVPLGDEPPALRFWWHGTAEHVFQVEVGAIDAFGVPWRSVNRLRGNGGARNSIYCLPPWTFGSVLDLTFSLVDEGPGEPTTLRIDDVEIVVDPACGDSKELLDPGFESAPNAWFGGYLFGPQTDAVRLHRDSDGGQARARTGDGSLEMKYETDDAHLSMETFVRVPDTGDECAELEFYSDVPAAPETTVEWVLGPDEGGERETLLSGGGWKRNAVPLPPEWAGRWVRLQVRVGPIGGSGEPISPARQIFLDDFAITAPVPCPGEP